MSQLSQSRCPNCGGELCAISEELLRCPYCGSCFENHSIQRKIAALQEFLDQTKIEYVNNQRRNLYDAVRAKYISKNEVHQYATEIKKLLPDDFQANFYLEALSGDVKKINALIREIDVEENYELLQPVVYFLTTSLQSEFLLELNLLIERAYKKRDLTLYSRYATKLSEEAAKVSAGVYETFVERDVFIAYSSKDMETVSKLCEELEDQGFSCFVAARNLRHGVGSVENYDEALKEAMNNCKCFLFVSSKNSRRFDCDAVRKEIPYIKEIDKQKAPAEFYNYYEKIPLKYKKPRIEYRLDTIKSAADRHTAQFFDGYEWVYNMDGLVDRLVQILTATPEDIFAAETAFASYAPAPQVTPILTPAPAPAPVIPFMPIVQTEPTPEPPIAKESAGLNYIVNSDGTTCSITGQGMCTDENIVIPKMIDGYPVTAIIAPLNNESSSGFEITTKSVIIPDSITEIGSHAFAYCRNLETLTIPNSVKSIGSSAFAHCENLTSIVMPNSITSIGHSAFAYCESLKHAVIPNSITTISAHAFRKCKNLKSVLMKNSVTTIEGHAFSDCTSIAEISIPESVTRIGDNAFAGIGKINVASNNPCYCSVDGSLYSKDCTTILYYAPTNTGASFMIPDTVTKIGNYAFAPAHTSRIFGYRHKITITIPSSVTSIGSMAFYGFKELDRFCYKGTKKQWKQISLGFSWRKYSAIRKVECTDGDIKFLLK